MDPSPRLPGGWPHAHKHCQRPGSRSARDVEKNPAQPAGLLVYTETTARGRAHPLGSERPPSAAAPPIRAGAGQSRRSAPPTALPPRGRDLPTRLPGRDSSGAVTRCPPTLRRLAEPTQRRLPTLALLAPSVSDSSECTCPRLFVLACVCVCVCVSTHLPVFYCQYRPDSSYSI